MDFETYLEGLRGKTAAVIGIGVSNRPLIELLLRRHVTVTARDRKSREALGPLADELAAMGSTGSLRRRTAGAAGVFSGRMPTTENSSLSVTAPSPPPERPAAGGRSAG